MSATGRSEARQDQDRYITPPWAIERFLEAYQIPLGATVLDPGASEGELLSVVKQLRPDLTLLAIELRPECAPALERLKTEGVIANFVIGDFVQLARDFIEPGSVSFSLTNPPYSLAPEFIDATRKISACAAIHLLRLNFLGANNRREWHAQARAGVRVLPNRPSFTGFGGDSCEYGWFVYGDPSVACTLDVLARTPKEVISAWNERARKLHPEANPKNRKPQDPTDAI